MSLTSEQINEKITAQQEVAKQLNDRFLLYIRQFSALAFMGDALATDKLREEMHIVLDQQLDTLGGLMLLTSKLRTAP